MTHWRINGLQMFEKIRDLLGFYSCMSTTIRDSNSAITRCAFATTFTLITSNNGNSATDQTASEGETSSALSSRCHDNDSEASEAESHIARTTYSEASSNSGYVSVWLLKAMSHRVISL
jgi:hypothetical protein